MPLYSHEATADVSKYIGLLSILFEGTNWPMYNVTVNKPKHLAVIEVLYDSASTVNKRSSTLIDF